MSAQYYAVLTATGEQKIAAAMAEQATIKITAMAVGDGSGSVPAPARTNTSLVNETFRAPLNALFKEPNNQNYVMVAELIIPEGAGGFWVREMGLYDDENDLVAIANCPPTYKPNIIEGAARVQYVRMFIAVASTAAVELLVDPSVVLAPRSYVDSEIQALEARSQSYTNNAAAAAQQYVNARLQLDGHRLALVSGCLALEEIE